MQKNLHLGIVQSGPHYMHLEKSLEKAEAFMEQAGKAGVELLVFGETWLSGYPVWLDYVPDMGLWDHEATKKVYARMYTNSIEIPGPESRFLAELARKHQIGIVMGCNERVSRGPANGTLFNSMLIINKEGELLNHHRKLMPTYTEKLLYGVGDAQGLKAVSMDDLRVSGLICWEHWMPLTRQALHDSGEDIHVALWPKVHEMHQIASRQYAFEGRCFVIAVGQVLRVRDLPSEFDLPEALLKTPDRLLLNGGSCVIAPDGKYLLEPQWEKEGLIIQEIEDIEQVIREQMTLDVSGHYQRPDVFELKINRHRLRQRDSSEDT